MAEPFMRRLGCDPQANSDLRPRRPPKRCPGHTGLDTTLSRRDISYSVDSCRQRVGPTLLLTSHRINRS